jgi:uncharacterized protein YjbI with pentapeptide repeats
MFVEECDLGEVTLVDALATSLQLKNSRLRGGVLDHLRASRATLSNCLLQSVDGFETDLTGARLEHVQWFGCRMSGLLLKQAALRNVAFRDCDLSGARFQAAVFDGVDFRGTNLRGAQALSPELLLRSVTDGATILPNGTRGPYVRFSGAERPAATP